MSKGNNSFRDRATKNAVQNHDRPKLDRIQNYCMENHFGVRVSKSNHRFDNKNFLNKPKNHDSDLIFNGLVHCQHDTVKSHCELGFENEEIKREDKEKHRLQTQKRNAGYYKANIPFFVINEDLARILVLDEGALSVYLYYHSLMLKNAREYRG